MGIEKTWKQELGGHGGRAAVGGVCVGGRLEVGLPQPQLSEGRAGGGGGSLPQRLLFLLHVLQHLFLFCMGVG